MERRFKLKISGESPRSLILAFILSKFKCDIYLNDFATNTCSDKDDQIFSYSNSSKKLLSKFNLWNELKEFSYGFTSMCIKDNLISKQLLLRNGNCSTKYSSAIGWIINHRNVKKIFINKLINFDNVHFISKNQKPYESLNFDYEFNFYSYEKFVNLFKLPLSIFKRVDNQILIFKVYLRGNVEKRLYEINTTEGLLILMPLNKNLYQIIWNNASIKIKERSLRSKSYFLDNLTTLLPDGLKVDQIIGDINFLHDCNHLPTYLIKKNSIYFNEDKLFSNTLYDFNFDILLSNALQIFKLLDNNDFRNINILNKLGFSLLIKYLGIIMNYSFTNYLINLFMLNTKFLLFFRKFLFILFEKINLLKMIFMKIPTNININKLNK